MPAPRPSSPEPEASQAAPGPRRSWWRWLAFGCLALAVLVLGSAIAAYVLVGRYDFADLAASRASAKLGRRVGVDSLRVTPGRWLTIEAQGVRLDNIEGGSRPLMAELAQLTAEVEATSLIWGPATIRKLTINGLDGLLERNAERTGNWSFGPARPRQPGPADRSGFPTLLEAHVNGSVVGIRTSSGKVLQIRVDQAAILTPAADQPVHMTISGLYNAVPVTLDAALQPIAVLRDSAVPYGTKLHFTSGQTTLDFDGTMTDPLDVDGAKGRLALDAPTPEAILAIAGVASTLDASLSLAGAFERQGDLWTLADGAGALNDGKISDANLRLQEAPHGKPDEISAELAFDRLDLNELLGTGARGKRTDADMSLAVDRAPDTLVEARVTAGTLLYAGLRGQDAAIQAAVTPGQVELKELSFSSLGGKLWGSARIQAADKGGRISADLDADGVDVQLLRTALGMGSVPVQGKATAQAVIEAAGLTLNGAMRTARASAVLSMTGGSIAREVVEMASTDVRLLFRKARGMTPIACLLAAMDMRGGVGTVSPLRVRSAEGAIAGYARFDLNRRTLDMTIGSESASTGLFALDIPVRVSGPFANPGVSPAQWSASGRAQLAASNAMVGLPPGMQAVARRNRCSAR